MNLSKELERIKIFNKVNFAVLTTNLEKLKKQIPDVQQDLQVHRDFFKLIHQTWLQAFNLEPELLNLSKEEANALKNYFYANHLILRCKQSAVRVSPKIWEEIEDKMLRV